MDNIVVIRNTLKVVSILVCQSAKDKRGLPASAILLDEKIGRAKAILSARTVLRTAGDVDRARSFARMLEGAYHRRSL
ncbi:hypothetical protein EDC04DRAFT_2577350 [Pisolithus marmoratus]|nr:hypothetical protein EDC04DRAFT_2577350 [Pisolithus marmoratus]